MSVEPEILRLSHKLEQFGLAKASAKVYVALSASGNSSANRLAELSGVHRVEVYRRLDELLRLGFVSVNIGRPSTYQATDPHLVLEQLTETKIQDTLKLSEARDSLLKELAGVQNQNPTHQKDEGSTYQLIAGRRKGYAESERMVESARNEILRVISSNDLIRNQRFGLIDSYRARAKMGIRVRIISDFSRVPKRLVHLCVGSFSVRHSPASAVRLLVVDRHSVLLGAVSNDSEMAIDSLEDKYLVMNDERIANAMALLFESLWSSSVAGKELL